MRILDLYNTFQVGVDYRLSERSALALDIGYGTQQTNLLFEDAYDTREGTENFRLNTSWKIYLGRRKMKGFYLGPTLGYRYSSFTDSDGAAQYFPLTRRTGFTIEEIGRGFLTVKQDLTFRLLIGKQKIWWDRLLFDFYLGVGFKYMWADTEEGSALNENDIFRVDVIETGDYFLPAIALGFKLGVLFHKRK
ncbi:MAG: hypothetical protein ACFB0B_13300 [Thermonemataceae bacterium]